LALHPGTRLGAYDITAQIGEGGMGQVFRARDTKLNRDVALKVLPDSFASDADRLVRFTREAQTLAALNHPNIAHIHGLEEGQAGPAGHVGPFLVMELVEGEDLSQRIARGAIPLDEALPIAKQIAEALEAAHEQGIIHRDLKPANIKVRPDGTVKVLDFGLAKALDRSGAPGGSGRPGGTDLSASPTITSPAQLTGAGIILGTAAYMAPEQARGKAVDRRADIWAFGVVLYEMLTGQRAFKGEELSDVLAAVLRQDFDWSVLPASTPPRLRRLLARCLDRDPRMRLRDIGEARIDIDKVVAGDRDDATALSSRRAPFRAAGWIAAAVLGLASVGLGWRVLHVTPAVEAPTVRFAVPLPGSSTRILGYTEVSPDGQLIVFTGADEEGRSQLWVRPLAEAQPRPLAGTEGATNPCWSPDGRALAFVSGRQVKKIRIDSGQVETVTDLESGGVNGMAWAPDGTILLALNLGSLQRVSAAGGTLEPFTTLDAARKETRHYYPALVPDGRHVLFVVTSGLPEAAGVWVAALGDPKDRHRVLPDLSIARVSQGHLLFARRGTLMAQPFDMATLAVTGEPAGLGEAVGSNAVGGFADFSVSESGVLAIGAAEPEMRMTTLDRSGRALATFGSQALRYQFVRISPDQRYVAADAVSPGGYHVFVFDPERNTTTPLTSGEATGNFPVWSPDGNRIVFGSNRNGVYDIFIKSSSGSSSDDVLLANDRNKFVFDWSRDGRFILYGEDEGPSRKERLWVLPMTGDRKPSLYLDESVDLRDARFSPDGRWVAYTANQPSGSQVFIRSFPDPAVKLQVSVDRGVHPAWRDDGRELFFIGGASELMAVELSPGPSLRLGTPTPLFRTGLYNSLLTYDVYRDGQRFVMPAFQAGDQSVRVILNWLRLVKS
jgi:eukaryotic-like serine/threonine-protein kinase